ncbi:MAG: sigma-70 family RNA polymerase sigma factor [Phycisphaerales bacterium]|nr:sigma-70 family RNA polymerase sigma factor [Phycisphaerae bacterium]NNF41635.1 sigma-70 family RNA polymerase sigma factor [Phycisphaerales bacterium]NNM24585.1 sigma-70 family RNA polymerase sigma factor [Phycisphaerales bacterium]
MNNARHDSTRALRQLRGGSAGASELMPAMYEELRRLAGSYLRGQPPDHTLQPTALVHEAFLRLIDQRTAGWEDETHFFAVAATVMRHVLVNHAEKRSSLKRGGDRLKLTLDEQRDAGIPGGMSDAAAADVLALHHALDELARLDERKGRVVELRWFGGMTHEQIAETLAVSKRTVDADWQMARAWLSKTLNDGAGG